MSVDYIHSVAADTLNALVHAGALHTQIEAAISGRTLEGVTVDGDVLTSTFDAALNGGQSNALDSTIGAHDGVAPVEVVANVITGPVSPSGRIRVDSAPPEASQTIKLSHDWTDPTTWYEESVRVVDEVLTCDDPGTYTLYGAVNQDIIDAYHGRIFGEEYLTDSGSNSYRVELKVNDVVKTEQDPHLGTGGDFTVDYAAGQVTMLAALIVSDVVKLTHHYENGSEWTLAPAPGKKLEIERVKVTFSDGVAMNDTIIFQTWVGGAEYGDPLKYKTMDDLSGEASGWSPAWTAQGGGGWRGQAEGRRGIVWRYAGLKILDDDVSAKVIISLEHDVPMTGSYSVATFYCLSE